MGLLAILFFGTTASAEEPLVWAGAGGDSGVRVDSSGVSILTSQVEFDLRAAKGPLYLKLDLDVHVDPGADPLFAAFPKTPEEAYLQIGRKGLRLRAGVTNPALCLQAWDAWLNYFPTYGANFDYQPGQVLGGDAGMSTASGWELALYGGWDMAWESGVFGAYATTEREMWSTWSGVAAWPGLGYYGVFPAIEVYPAGWLWVDLDLAAGVVGAAPFAGGQVILNFFPESQPNPVLRVQKYFDPQGASDVLGLDPPDTSVSIAMNFDPEDYLRLSAEGRVEWRDGFPESMGIFYVAFHPVEPDDDYATFEDESAAE